MGPLIAAIQPTTAGMSWLLSSSVKAAVLLAGSWLAAILLRRSTAAARHQVWALGVAGALLLPLLCWALPSLPLSMGPPTSSAGRSVLATAVLVTGGHAAAAQSTGPAWPWLAMAWAAGTLLVSFRFLRGHFAARRLARAAEPVHAEAWLSAQREAAASLGVTADVRLGRSETIRSPMTIGVLRPRVLLPAAAEGWSSERLRAVLLHELGHVRRRDALIQLGAQLACALYWWNPLTWLAGARLRIEREHACDDLVLAAGIRASSYAADLLEVARSIARSEATLGGTLCMVDRSWTETRLRRILDSAAPRQPLGIRFRLAARGATVTFAMTLACTSALARPAPSREGREEAVLSERRGALWLGAPSMNGADAFGRRPAYAPKGDIDLSLVAAEVKRQLGDLNDCYERRLLVHPELSGKVVIHWNITTTGEVPEQCITEDTVGDEEVVSCVNELVKKSRFPAARGSSVDVSFPFEFAPLR